jgi:hypothetical protein
MNRIEVEFLKIGFSADKEPDKWIIEGVSSLLEIFSNQGHSGFSAPYAIRLFEKMSKFESIESVKKEFVKMGYKPIEELENDIDKWMQEGTIELFEKLKEINHTEYLDKIVQYFVKLANHEPLASILCTDDEWNDVSDMHGFDVVYQNNRLSSVFKEGKNGKPYYLDAIVWKNQKGITYTGSAMNSKGAKIRSRQIIKLPFEPKTFYIDVFDYEIAPDDWEFKIVDEKQLEEVWKYYENPIIEERKNKLDQLGSL